MRDNRGFTLIEMLIVVALIMIMTAILLARTNAMGRQATLNISTADIVSLIREARQDSVAIEGVVHSGSTYYPSYGVHFDVLAPSQAILYADCVADDSANSIPPIVDANDSFYFDQANCAFPSTQKTYAIPEGVTIDRIEASYLEGGVTVSTAPEEVSMLFLRPEPTVWITVRESGTRKVLSAGEVTVVLQDSTTGNERTVTFSTNAVVANTN